MSLGVLNNLNAIYAENNLNNTSASLSTVLQQLSSGSKINSGADDAAGLSLVDGLQANSMALTQSKTNATEGVGLLTVADGALSQVTNLLNRAVTLATEASNGTLNSSQDTAANQEYQSILSEISNIGTTTTYNDQNVFGTQYNIFTGDSSTTGASIDVLNIRNLSSSNLGDSSGVMAYSNGSNNVFINLSSSTNNAQSTDTLNASGTTAININYLVKGANGSENMATTTITVGTGTSYANTANGMISAINNAGLGLSASFTTQSGAGVQGGGTQTGIKISGGAVSVGTDPSASVTSGKLNGSGVLTGKDLTPGQTLSITVGGTSAVSLTIDSSTSTLSALAAAINAATSNATTYQNAASTYVTATVLTNGDGTQSLQLSDTNPSSGALVVTTGGTPDMTNTLGGATTSTNAVALTFTTSGTGNTGTDAQATLGISGPNSSSQALTGSVVLNNGSSTKTFVMGGVAGVSNGTVTVGASTLGSLAAAIQSNLGVSTTVGSGGITMVDNTAGQSITMGTSTLTATPSVSTISNVAGATAAAGSQGTLTISMVNGAGATVAMANSANETLTLGTSIVLQSGNMGTPGTAVTFVIGNSNTQSPTGTTTATTITTANNTMASLLTSLTNSTTLGLASATVNGNGQLVLTSTANAQTISMNNSTLTGSSDGIGLLGLGTDVTHSNNAAAVTGSVGHLQLQTGVTTATTDTLSGTVVLTNTANSVSDTFVMGSGTSSGSTIYTGAGTLNSLLTSINGTGLGVSATLDSSNNGIDLVTTTNGSITLGTDTLADNYAMTATTPASGGGNQYDSMVIAPTSSVLTAADVTSGSFSGTMVVTNDVNGTTNNYTFVMGGSASAGTGTTGGTYTVGANTITALKNAINAENALLDVNAQTDSATGGIFIQSLSSLTGSPHDTALAATVTNFTDNVTVGTTTANVGGAGAVASAATAASLNIKQDITHGTAQGGTTSSSDNLTGSLILNVNGTLNTFTMGTGGNSAHQFYTGGSSLSSLLTAISNNGVNGLGLTASMNGTNNGITVTYSNNTSTNALVFGSSTLTDADGMSAAGSAGTDASGASSASVIIGTGGTMTGTDVLTGTIVLANGGANHTYVMGTGAGAIGGSTLSALQQAISNDNSLSVVASISGGSLELNSTVTNTSITVGTNTLTDTVSDTLTQQVTPVAGVASSSTFTLASGAANVGTSDVLTGNIAANTINAGSIAITANGHTQTFVMGTGTSTTSTIYTGGNTVSSLLTAINGQTSSTNVTASISGQNLVLASNVDNATAVTATSNLSDAFATTASNASLGSFASLNDTVSGSIVLGLTGVNSGTAKTLQLTNGETVQQMINQINTSNLGVTASAATGYDLANQAYTSVTLTSNAYGTNGDIVNYSGTQVTDTTGTTLLSYVGNNAYNVGLSNTTDSSTALYDSSANQTNPTSSATPAYTNFVSNASSGSGVATISYSDGAGVDLSSTDLTNQTDAQSALKALNQAISSVAAQDGYIGAQINTLNAVSQVLSTQQENVTSAQNAVQATDYASATSNLSKYEILSQTGISALAQANSLQQEVTKLLQ